MEFNGSELRLARVFNGFSLEEVAEAVGKTRQYIHKLETGQAMPTDSMIIELGLFLRVLPGFFFNTSRCVSSEEQFHFRKLFTTRAMVKQVAMARGEMLARLAAAFDREIKLPKVDIPDFGNAATSEEIEVAAENCRREWGLGMGPITDMNRLAEHIGVMVTSFHSLSKEVDALSVATARPLIVRNEAKESVCRQRFDIGHELGHLVLHAGVPTGDRDTEGQANRFSGSLLIPRSMMAKLFPRPKGSRLDWNAISEFKLTWKMSKAAILYRARKLELITDEQYKTGAITLRRTGEALGEREDYKIPPEGPELLSKSFQFLAQRKEIFGGDVAALLNIKPSLLEELVGFPIPKDPRPKKNHLALVA
ncbi:XRE family transcriptional regulator [Variovorax paradoxus]|uniref:helix-turn-helix domain-containing protein n=1 Tax=Variovorax paradoxus TaxID=34073 RepID=UPI001ABCEF65